MESQNKAKEATLDDLPSFMGVCTNIWLQEKTALRSNWQKRLSTMWSEVTLNVLFGAGHECKVGF